MLTGHFIRILVETVLWQRRSSFKTVIVHNILGNFRGYVGLVDGILVVGERRVTTSSQFAM